MNFKAGDRVRCLNPVGELENGEIYDVEAVYLSSHNSNDFCPRLKLKGLNAEYYTFRFGSVDGEGPSSNQLSFNSWLNDCSTDSSNKELLDENGIPMKPVKARSSLRNNTELAYEECLDAMCIWPKFNSAHEGFAVLQEEVDELWEHIKLHPNKRNNEEMKKEAIQVAAMALRFVTDLIN